MGNRITLIVFPLNKPYVTNPGANKRWSNHPWWGSKVAVTTSHGALGVATTTPHGTEVGCTTPKAFVVVVDHLLNILLLLFLFFFFCVKKKKILLLEFIYLFIIIIFKARVFEEI
jgi:hypothetical protein